jgi:hypothetical protein
MRPSPAAAEQLIAGRRTSMLRDCERRLLSSGESIRARAGPNRDHRCAANLGLLDRAAGVSGGIATLPGLGELKVRLLLLGHQLKISWTRRSEADVA